ncbi:hypothetical protein H8E88_34995 [candidate division KSB1 bacterium]|nr:hypothetical protein [candidate division KSB1 bacterium]
MKVKTIFILLVYILLSNGVYSQDFSIPLKAVGRIFRTVTDTMSVGTAFVAGKTKAIYTCSHVAVADTL